jgi:NAD(P)-dependent dehydrogenase (short-subunit alcohol dehydrogenase family)
VALVTGGGRGLGAAIAARFAAEGARAVFVMDIAAPPVEAPGVTYLLGDVTRPADCNRCAAEARGAHGRIDALVNNAGISRAGFIHAASSAIDWRDVLDVNLNGAFHMIQAVLPHMMEAGPPSCILNISSIAADVVNPVIHPGYAASKGALISLTRHLAVTHARFGIRCCAIAPGAVRTSLWDGLTDDVKALYAGLHPLGVGDPDDVAALTAFLASDEARWITGAVLHIDGGNLASGGLSAYARQTVH